MSESPPGDDSNHGPVASGRRKRLENGDAAKANGGASTAGMSPGRIALSSAVTVGMMIVGYTIFVLVRISSSPEWAFSIEARSDVVSVVTARGTETNWRIDGAVICTTGDAPDSARIVSVDPVVPCGSRRWHASRIESPEAVLRLEGESQIHMERQPSFGFALSVRAGSASGIAGQAASSDGRANISLGQRANIVWPIAHEEFAPGSPLIFPFSGETTIGRDVGWADSRLLYDGTVAVYSADDSVDQRRKIDEAKLMLGDQVRLGVCRSDDECGGLRAKGFVRWTPSTDGGDPLSIVAFGRADGLFIDRFGENGYSFTPDWKTRLLNDPWILLLGAAFLTVLSVWSNLRNLLGIPSLIEGHDSPDRSEEPIAATRRNRSIFGRVR